MRDQTDRQADQQTYRDHAGDQTGTTMRDQTCRQIDQQTPRWEHADRQTDRQTDETNRHTGTTDERPDRYRQTDRPTDIQGPRWETRHRQTYRHTKTTPDQTCRQTDRTSQGLRGKRETQITPLPSTMSRAHLSNFEPDGGPHKPRSRVKSASISAHSSATDLEISW